MRLSIVRFFIALMVGWVAVTNPQIAHSEAKRQEPAADCPHLIARYEQSETLQASLIDPILNTQEEIDQAALVVQHLNSCLADSGEQLSDQQRMLLRLTEYFLAFIAGDDAPGFNSRLELVDLETTNDPAVSTLRDEVRLPAPPGFVFMRYYPSRQAMPEVVRRAFENPEVAGATYLTRYIAILEEQQPSWAEKALQSKTLPATTSHELVHAYLNASLGPYQLGSLPRWYHEGLAVYFSGSGEEHSVITPGFSLSQTTSAEYKRFELIFEYLQDQLGDTELNALLRQSIEAADASPLYQAVGLDDERWLEQTALSWQARRQRSGYLIVLLVACAVFAGLYLMAPDYECACGHTGHRRDFVGGVCNECGRQIAVGQSLQRWKPLRLRASCQVCGRSYWRWQFDQLHFHQWKVRIWTGDPAATGIQDVQRQEETITEPPHAWVHRVCTVCAHTSQSIYQEYAQKMEIELASARQRSLLLYHAWLNQAPLRPYNSLARQESYYLSAMVEWCVRAALVARYPDWVSDNLAFHFPPDPDLDYTQITPGSYTSILQREAELNGHVITLVGTLGRLNRDLILVEWQPERIEPGD